MAGVSAFFDHALGNVLAAAWALLVTRSSVPPSLRERGRWGEALSLPEVLIIGALAIQLERLIISKRLSKEAFAALSALSSVAIFPFRITALDAGFALVPRLQSARDIAAGVGSINCVGLA